jgi:hypothetical protein
LLVPVFAFLFKVGYSGGFFGKDKDVNQADERKGLAGKKEL